MWNAASTEAVSTDEEAESEAKYRFIRHYVDRSNFPADKVDDPVHHHSSQIDDDTTFDAYTFALDGQQRLTSFLIALRGSFYEHRYRKHTNKVDSYHKKHLCLDLLTDPNRAEPDDAQENIYNFEFRRKERYDHNGEKDDYDAEEDEYWLPVCAVWDDGGEITNDVTLSPERFADGQIPDRVDENLTRLQKALTADQIPCEEVSGMRSKEALELFVRRNKGGEELSNSDIAFSLITVYWEEFDEDEDPKQVFEERAAKLTEDFGKYGFGFGKGFLIRALLYLNCEKPSFERDNLVPETIKPLGDDWGKQFFDAIRMTFNLVAKEFRLTDKCLSGKTSLLPILYYCWQGLGDGSLEHYTDIPDPDQTRIEYWIELTVLNNIFSVSSSMTVLDDVREYISKHSFRVSEIVDHYKGGSIEIGIHGDEREDGRTVANLVTGTDHSSKTTVRSYLLTKLYDERAVGKDFDPDDDEITVLEIEAEDEVTSIEIDHFFPASKLRNNENYLDNADFDLDEEEFEAIKSFCSKHVNEFANFTLLPHGAGNQSKGKKDPEVWLGDCNVDEAAAKEIHHLPDMDPYTYVTYEEFLENRRETMIEILNDRLVLEDQI